MFTITSALVPPSASVELTGDTTLRGTKTLTGRDMKENEAFEFTLTAGDDNTQTAIRDGAVTIAENGDIAVVTGASGTATARRPLLPRYAVTLLS